jgi:hypothetical protein
MAVFSMPSRSAMAADPKWGGFLKDQDNPLETDLLVTGKATIVNAILKILKAKEVEMLLCAPTIDEASMVDVPLMHALLKALPNRAALLIAPEELCMLAEKLLEVPADLIETAIALELQEVLAEDRIDDRDCVFLAGLYQAEKAIGERLSQITRGKPA